MQLDCQNFICNAIGGMQNIAGGVQGAITFAQDPFGSIFKSLQDAASGLARDVLPAVTAATLPDLSLQWFLQAYGISFAAALLLAVVVLIVQFTKVARGAIAGRDLLETMGVYFPTFLLGAMFGPAVGVMLVNFFHALSNDVIAWGVAGSTDKLTSIFVAMIRSTDPVALTGGVIVTCLLMLCMVIGLLLVLLLLIVQLVTLYFTGVLVPLGLVWILDPGRRPFGLKLAWLWLGILAAHPLLFFLLGVTFNMVAGSIVELGAQPPLQALVTLAVAIISLFVSTLAPMMLLRFAPVIPTGSGGSSGPSLGRGNSFGAKNMFDAHARYTRPDVDAVGRSRTDVGTVQPVAASARSTAGQDAVAARSLSGASAARAAAGFGAKTAASGGKVAATAGARAATTAAAGAAETATGAGAAIGIPTLIAASAAAASAGIKAGHRTVDHAVAPMDDRGIER